MQSSSINSWVIVTGGTGGIGKALIMRLAARGQNVVATAREPERIFTAPGPGRIVGVQLDMERPETMAVAAGEVARIVGGGRLLGLVNMAGVIVEGPLETIQPAELRRQLEINLVGPFALTQALLPLLKQARGRVVNIGAISAHLTIPFYGPIAASKSALASLSDAMRLEFAQYGMNVILIEPGAMKTGISDISGDAGCQFAGVARARAPLPPRSDPNGSRLRKSRSGRSGGRRRRRDDSPFPETPQAKSSRWQRNRRVAHAFASSHSYAGQVCEKRPWPDRCAQAGDLMLA